MKRLSFCILFIAVTSSTFSQFTLDRKKSSFGISLDANVTSTKMTLSQKFLSIYDGKLVKADSKLKPGFGLGIFYLYRFNEKFGLKTQANLSFLETIVDFEIEGSLDQTFSRQREQVFIELPISLIYENLNKKISPTFSLGGRLGYDITEESNAITTTEDNQIHLGLEAGIGVAFSLNKFVFRPELILSNWMTEQSRFIGVPEESYERHGLGQMALRFSFYGL